MTYNYKNGKYSMKVIEKECAMCKSLFQLKCNKQKYCSGCKKINDKRILYEGQAKYRQTHKGKKSKAVANRNRKAYVYKVIHNFTTEQWMEKLNKTNGICPNCKVNVGLSQLELDHIYPLSKAKEGRIYTINDIQPLCKVCNVKKSNILMV